MAAPKDRLPIVLPSAVDQEFMLAHGRLTQFEFDPDDMCGDDKSGESDEHEATSRRARNIAALEEIPDYLVATYIRMADSGVAPADRTFAASIAFRAAVAVQQWKGATCVS